jgi:hypothetical protein
LWRMLRVGVNGNTAWKRIRLHRLMGSKRMWRYTGVDSIRTEEIWDIIKLLVTKLLNRKYFSSAHGCLVCCNVASGKTRLEIFKACSIAKKLSVI